MRVGLKFTLAAGTILMGAAITQAQAETNSFGNAYFFGDSLTDCCGAGRSTTNNAPNWADQLPPAIGATYTATFDNNLAVGGAQTGFTAVSPINEAAVGGVPSGFLSQVARFAARGGAISSRDIAGIWIGTNDIWPSAQAVASEGIRQQVGPRPAVSVFTDYLAGNVRTGIDTLVDQGIRNIVLASPYDLGVSEIFSAGGSNDATTRALATQYSEAFRDRLATLYTPGVNTYFLDSLTLLRRVQEYPDIYGFESVTSGNSCADNPDCLAAQASVQSRYVFSDMIHLSSGFDQLMADYIANIINARTSLPAQSDLGQAVGQTFSNTLLDRLDAHRRLGTAATTAITDDGTLSVFVEGTSASFDRDARSTSLGPDTPRLRADLDGVTVGVEYRITPNLLVGGAFNYLNTSVDRTDLDSYQGSIFTSYNTANFFVDGAVTYGVNKYDISRPGVIDTLKASPDGNTLTAAGKIGYLFDLGTFQVGPIADLTYANVDVDSYRERGDSLLTMGVRSQSFEALTGGAGLQFRTTLPVLGLALNPFLNIMAQHDFLDGERSITSFGTSAPALLIDTDAGRQGDSLYGKVAGGFTIELGKGFSGGVSGSTTFGRTYGNDYAIRGGVEYRF